MRVGLIADVHANKPALDAVIDAIPTVDGIACAGDVVGYNPWPGACIDALRVRDIPTIMGNHDRMVVTGRNFRGNAMASAGVDFARQELSEEQHAWLSALPEERELFDGAVRVVHGHPDDPDHYTYPEEFTGHLLSDERALVLGHTHVQYHEAFADGVIVNPGSVGQPRDGDPRAAFAVLDLEDLSVEERRVAYDVKRVRDAITDAGLPDRTGARLLEGR